MSPYIKKKKKKQRNKHGIIVNNMFLIAKISILCINFKMKTRYSLHITLIIQFYIMIISFTYMWKYLT